MIADLGERDPGHETHLRILVEAHRKRANELGKGKGEGAIKAYFQGAEVKSAIQTSLEKVRSSSPKSWFPALVELELYPYLGIPQQRVNQVVVEAAQRGEPRWTGIVVRNWLPNLQRLPSGNKVWLMRFMLQGALAGDRQLINQLQSVLIGRNPNSPNRPKAAYHMARVLGEGGSDAMLGRAVELMRNGVGTEKDEAGAVAEHLANSKAGSAACTFHYGMIRYLGSSGTSKDRKLGLEFVTRAAEQGYYGAYIPLVQIHLGLAEGGTVDLDKAEKWLRVAERYRMPQAKSLRAALEKARAEK